MTTAFANANVMLYLQERYEFDTALVPLKTAIITNDAPDFDCPVCMTTVTDGAKKVQTECNHHFCTDCFTRLPIKRTHAQICVNCPLCRTKITPFDQPAIIEPTAIPLEQQPLSAIRRNLNDTNISIAAYERSITDMRGKIAETLESIAAREGNTRHIIRMKHSVISMRQIIERHDTIVLSNLRETQILLQEQVQRRGRRERRAAN